MIRSRLRRSRFPRLETCLAAGLALGCLQPCLAEERENGAITFAFSLENDVFAGTDRDYTNGAKLAWDYAEAPSYEDIGSLPAWARAVANVQPGIFNAPDAFGATISFGQSIYTPENKETTELVPDDRPYAGWTYLSLALRERRGRSVDSLELTLGVIGPDSFAEDVQNWVHEKIGSAEARGWDNQLKNEIGGILAWRRDTQLFTDPDSADGWGADLTSSFGFALGNVETYAHAGADLRFGRNRHSTGTAPRIRSGNTSPFPSQHNDPRLGGDQEALGFFINLGVESRYVARNIFVEGNTWADSHGLDLEPWVTDAYAGITVMSGSWSLSYVYTRRTREFPEQNKYHLFSGLTLARTF